MEYGRLNKKSVRTENTPLKHFGWFGHLSSDQNWRLEAYLTHLMHKEEQHHHLCKNIHLSDMFGGYRIN